MIEELSAFLIAVLAAIVYALGGYLKNTPPKEFDDEKFFTTLILGILIGFVSYFYGIQRNAAEQLLVSAGLVAYIEVWGKAAYRRIRAWIKAQDWST